MKALAKKPKTLPLCEAKRNHSSKGSSNLNGSITNFCAKIVEIEEKKNPRGKKFSFFLRKSPYFWGKKLCLLKKSIFIYRKSINPQSIFVKPNTPFLHLLCLYNLLGFLGCSLLLGFPLAPTLRAGASPSRGSFCSLRSHPNGCRGAPL